MENRLLDIFGPGSNASIRIVRNPQEIERSVIACRTLGLRIVLTSGTFDLSHVGHSRYFEQAKRRGDILIVGVDSDKKVQAKKGPHRPVVHEEERMKSSATSGMLTSLF
ncbi:MAG: adenylyltransferase/cytidyltransferase family protein [bacterium]